MSVLPRVTAFPILAEDHMLYKVGGALSMPTREKHSSPLLGHPAPEIILKDQLGRDCSLHATIALGRPIVLFFFPLAGSPHCTIQSCLFRDALTDSAVFADLDAIIIGISQDTPETLTRFVGKHDLGYIVLSDHEREAMQAFGVTRTWMGLVNSRSTFIIDHNGIVRAQCDGVLSAVGHRQFAEKWLIRIEHELVGREKSVEGLDDDPVMIEDRNEQHGSMDSQTTAGQRLDFRVVRGEENSARSAGIDKAPRYGAAPLANPPHQKRSNGHSLRSLISKSRIASAASSSSSKLSSPQSQSRVASRSNDELISSSSSNGRSPNLHAGEENNSSTHPRSRSAASKASTKSLRKAFHRKEAPPLPPTYQNLDEDIGHLPGNLQAHEVGHGAGHRSVDSSVLSDGHSTVSSSTSGLSHNNSSGHTHASSSGSRASQGVQRSAVRDKPYQIPSLIPLRPGELDVYTTPSSVKQPSSALRIDDGVVSTGERNTQSTLAEPDHAGTSNGSMAHQASAVRPPMGSQMMSRDLSSSTRRPNTAPSTQPSGVLSPHQFRSGTEPKPPRRGVLLSPSSMSSMSHNAGPQITPRTRSRSHQTSSSSSSSTATPGTTSRPNTAGSATGGGRSSLETVTVDTALAGAGGSTSGLRNGNVSAQDWW